jgi:hypothetical protein
MTDVLPDAAFPVAAFGNLTDLIERVTTAHAAINVHSGSALAGDDEWTKPYHLSHVAWHALSNAVDHLHMLHTSIAVAGTLHRSAPFTLIRVGVENAATAIWLTQPAQRSDRVLRRLQLHAANVKASDKALQKLGRPSSRPLEDRLQQIKDIAAARGLLPADAVKRPDALGDRVQEAAGAIDFGAELGAFMWQAGSAFAHGDLWTTLGLLEREELVGDVDGDGDVVRLLMTAPVEVVATMTRAAMAFLNHGFALYERRGARHY